MLAVPTMLEAIQLYVPASAAITRVILRSPVVLLKAYGMRGIICGLGTVEMSIGLKPSGRVHRIEGTGWPTTLHWRIWVESKMATGWAGEMVTAGGTVCLRSEEGKDGN